MSDPLPEDTRRPVLPEAEARSPVAPPVQGTAPAWEDPSPAPSSEQLVLEARVRQALREAAMMQSSEPLLAAAEDAKFTVEQGGRTAMQQTAGRIGHAVGTAEREVRRTLQLVRRPTAIEFPSNVSAAELAERASRLAREGTERAARLMHGIETDATSASRQAAQKLEDWSERAEERFQQLRQQASTLFSRSRARARELADAYPLQVIAAVAGTCFVLGIALRIRRSNHG